MQAMSAPVIAGEPFPEEFEDLFQEHYVLVYRTAYGITGRVEDAEDVAQTVFLRLLKRDFRLKAEATGLMKNPKGYLYRAAVNVSLTIVQARQRRARTETNEELTVSVACCGD